MISLKNLTDKRIFIWPASLHKEQILQRLVQAICKEKTFLDEKVVLAQILQREKMMSTTLDTGLSIPHIRVEELEQAVAALAILPQAVAEPNGKKIKVVFLFLSPSRAEFFQQHLQLLARLAELFTPAFITQLTQAATPDEAEAVLAKNNF